MHDKELLEFSAKVAGIELDWDIPQNSNTPWRMTGDKGSDNYGPASQWNPLTDDGDALRLAVKLGLDIDRTAQGWVTIHSYERQRSFESVSLGDDLYAATRRAIVRAAAEIGKGIE